MAGERFTHVYRALLAMSVLRNRIRASAFTCGIQNFNETLVNENGSLTNITYLLNVTETKSFEQTSIFFDVCQNNTLTTQCTFKRITQFNDISVRNWGSGNQTSCSCERLNVSQSMLTWKLTISKLVDRSLSVMRLYIKNVTHSEKMVQMIHLIHVEVLYPPIITSLTVDGQEAGSTYLIDKGQKVNISCFYDQGNPPETFRLVDKHGNGLAWSVGNLTQSLSAQCEDDWPTVRCEGNGSEQNRSVSFLVRCPPAFVDSSVKIVTPPELESITLPVKAHTTAFNECYLSSEKSSRQEVNCTLTGNPSDLVLALHFNKVRIAQGNWTVTLANEMGYTNTTISIMDKKETQHIAALEQLLFGLLCGAALLAAVIAFVVILAKTLVKQHSQGPDDGYGSKASVELQGDATIMIVNDIYESSGGIAAGDAIKSLGAPPLPPPRTLLSAAEAPARPARSRAHDNGCASTAAHDQEAHIHPDVSVMDVRERKKISKNKVRFEDRHDGACTTSSANRAKGKQAKECRTRVVEETDEAIAPASLGTPSTSGRRNADGLIYGDLDFTDREVSDVIIGSASGIEYTRINTTAIAPPPRDYKQKYNRKR